MSDPYTLAVDHLTMIAAALGCNSASQILSARWIVRMPVVLSLLGGFVFGFMVLGGLMASGLILGRALDFSDIPWVLVALSIYGGVSYDYFHFVNIGEASIRLRVMREVTAMKGCASISDVSAIYNADWIIDARLGRLVASGQVTRGDDGRYRLGNKRQMLMVAKAFRYLKGVVLGRGRCVAELRNGSPMSQSNSGRVAEVQI